MKRTIMAVIAFAFFAVACGNDDEPAREGAQDGRHNAADVLFAQGMIPHHEQAIHMSDLALKHASRPQVKDLAARIKAAQNPEIETMKRWLADWGEPLQAHGGEHAGGHGVAGMGMLSESNMQELEEASGSHFERLFLEGMIRHHEGALEMAEDEIDRGRFRDAKALARRIVEAQRAEIAEMRGLLAG